MSHNKIVNFIFRYHLAWVAFYFLILSAGVAYAYTMYKTYDSDQLPSGHIELQLSKERYQVGEIVEFTVFNHFPTIIYVTNHCPNEPLNVYTWRNEEWVQVHEKTANTESKCYLQDRNIAIQPEASISYSFEDWPNLFSEPGIYRIAMVVDHYNDIPFQDFVVLEPQEIIEVLEEPTVIQKELPPTQNVTPVTEDEEIVQPEEEYYEEEDEHEDEEEDHDEEDDEEEDHDEEDDEHEDEDDD